jgi:ParB family transcriptional regulator, chromosome partitioning protein
MENAVQVSNEYRSVPVTALVESASNPRKRFDAKSLEELAASFKAQGVLQPLLVRAIEEDKYEVIAGGRRLRAAKLATLKEVPVRVVELSDAACIETQLVENIHRENAHPLEEAFAFYGLLHTDGLRYDINSLAAKTGKSAAFVATRLRLVELQPSIAEAFLADEIGVGQALEIAKLPQPEQQRAFEAAFHAAWNGGKETRILRPVRDLMIWIEQNILLSLDSVAFDKNDETLVPEAGSCANCPKRTGFNTLLFDAALRDSCTDRDCFNNKLTKNVECQIADKPLLVQITTEWKAPGNSAVLGRNQYVAVNLLANSAKSKKPLSPHQKPCKLMTEAIVVDGIERGRITKVCAEPNCPVHFADRRAPNLAQVTKEREQRRKELERQKLDTTVRHRTLAEVLKRIGAPLDRADLALVASALLNKLEPLRKEMMARRHKLIEGAASNVTYPLVQQAIARMLRQSDEDALSKLLIEVVLLEFADRAPTGDLDVLLATARRHRVDVDKVRKAVEQEFTAKRVKRETKQDKATKKGATKTAA